MVIDWAVGGSARQLARSAGQSSGARFGTCSARFATCKFKSRDAHPFVNQPAVIDTEDGRVRALDEQRQVVGDARELGLRPVDLGLRACGATE